MSSYFDNVSVQNLICRCNICPPDWGEKDCVYAYHKFYYFMEGESTLIVEGDVFTPEPGELFLIPAYTKHTYYQNIHKPVLKYWSHFNLILDQEKKLKYNKETVKCTISKEQIIPYFSSLVEAYLSNDPIDVIAQKISLFELLKLFLANVDTAKILYRNSNDFSNIINTYIEQHIQSEITLVDLANLAHLHPNYFVKYFKKHFSVTPIAYVNLVRLQMASKLLTNEPELSIQQVAAEVGLHDYRYFSRLFKKKYGVSPSQYNRV